MTMTKTITPVATRANAPALPAVSSPRAQMRTSTQGDMAGQERAPGYTSDPHPVDPNSDSYIMSQLTEEALQFYVAGKPTGSVTSTVDLIARKQAIAALRELTRRSLATPMAFPVRP
jgi:hypothetical protein